MKLPTAQAGGQNISNLSQQEVLTMLMCHPVHKFPSGRRGTLRARGISPARGREGVDGQVPEQAAGGAVRLRHRDPPRGDAAQRQEPRRETLRAGTHQGKEVASGGKLPRFFCSRV